MDGVAEVTMAVGEEVQSTADRSDSRSKRILELRSLNTAARESHPAEGQKTYSSSLKAHATLLKRLRNSVGADTLTHNLNDIQSLSIEKYIDEVATAVFESLVKCKKEMDISAAVEVCSLLHQRFPTDFDKILAKLLRKESLIAPVSTRTSANTVAISNSAQDLKDKEDAAKLSRLRTYLRFMSEFWLVDIIRSIPTGEGHTGISALQNSSLSKDDTKVKKMSLGSFLDDPDRNFVLVSLYDLLQSDKDFFYIPLLISFLKSCPQFHLSKIETSPEPQSLDALVPEQVKTKITQLASNYFIAASKRLVKDHNKLHEQENRDQEAYIRAGEIFEDRQRAFERMQRLYERLIQGCQSLADILGLEMPFLPVSTDSVAALTIGAHLFDSGDAVDYSSGPWEDEQTRMFYETILDLADVVSIKLLETGVSENALDAVTNSSQDVASQKEPQDDPHRTWASEGEETHTVDATSQTGEQVTNLLNRMPEMYNRDMIDRAAVDFTYLNNKASRKRLIKTLANVPKNRTDLIPYYAKMAKILSKYMPDIGEGLIALVEDEFRYLQKKRNVVVEMQSMRLKNTRYIAELVKFQLMPLHMTLYCFKSSLDHFTTTDIEVLASLLENCGRYLLRTPETAQRMSTIVETMKRKQAVSKIDQRQILLLENAYYQCNPPAASVKQIKTRPVEESFLRHLIFDVLNVDTVDKVLLCLRRFNWRDPGFRHLVTKRFIKVWKLRTGQLPYLAMILADLRRWHADFVINITDRVFEELYLGIQSANFRHHQRMIAIVKYFGELYLYRVINWREVFDALWAMLAAYQNDQSDSLTEHCSRIRLACTLLDVCGFCFDKGPNKERLDNFLTVFQWFVLSKGAVPMEVSFMVADTMEKLRPNMRQPATADEAYDAVCELRDPSTNMPLFVPSRSRESAAAPSTAEHQSATVNDEILSTLQADYETQGIPMEPTRDVLERDLEDDFDLQLTNMMKGASLQGGAHQQRGNDLSDLAVPYVQHHPQQQDDLSMYFGLIGKRGNKQVVRSMGVPYDSSLALSARTNQALDKIEQQKLKKVVLDLDERNQQQQILNDSTHIQSSMDPPQQAPMPRENLNDINIVLKRNMRKRP